MRSGLSLTAAARAAGIARSTWNRAENGHAVTEDLHTKLKTVLPDLRAFESYVQIDASKRMEKRAPKVLSTITGLALARRARGWSLTEAARVCGVSRGAFTSAERGPGVQQNIVDAIRTTMGELAPSPCEQKQNGMSQPRTNGYHHSATNGIDTADNDALRTTVQRQAREIVQLRQAVSNLEIREQTIATPGRDPGVEVYVCDLGRTAVHCAPY